MDVSTCLATDALPSRLSLKPDQRAIRSSTFCRLAVREGCGGVGGLLEQMNARVLLARPLRCEGDSCGRIWTSKVAQGPQADTLGFASPYLSACCCAVEVHAGV